MTTDRAVKLKRIYQAYAQDRAFQSLREHGHSKRVVPGRGSLNPRITHPDPRRYGGPRASAIRISTGRSVRCGPPTESV